MRKYWGFEIYKITEKIENNKSIFDEKIKLLELKYAERFEAIESKFKFLEENKQPHTSINILNNGEEFLKKNDLNKMLRQTEEEIQKVFSINVFK